MMGPSVATFSAPTTRTSVKKDHTAHPANRLSTLCSVCASDSGIIDTVGVVRTAEKKGGEYYTVS